MAITSARVQTFARFDLLERQVLNMLSRAANVEQRTLDKVARGIRDPHYIESIIVRGLYRHGTIGAEMRLRIDWRTNSLEMKAGGSAIQTPSSWRDGIAPSIDEGVRTFLQACSIAGLSKNMYVVYQSHFDSDAVNRILGFVRSEPLSWERTPDSSDWLALGPLREASLVVRLAI